MFSINTSVMDVTRSNSSVCIRLHAVGRAAIARAKRLPGFRNHPRGFSVDPYVVDMTHWDEGFKTVWLGRGRPSSARRPSNKPLERTGRARRSAPIR